MFRGRYEHTIDQKGRISIPSRFREILAALNDERVIITNYDGALWAYPFQEWIEIEQKVSNLPQSNPAVRMFQRVFIAGATECLLDKQGRILIPPALRSYAGLNKDVILVGMIKRFELWEKEKWQKVFQQAQEDVEKYGDQLAEFGL